MVSGGFDPLHVGHLDYLQAAKSYGNLIVVLNSDRWLLRKKGYVFMSWGDRARILNSLSAVSLVTEVDDDDDTVCEALRRLRPQYFANGGDRKTPDPREDQVCRELGIEQLFGVGGKKIRSSSELVRMAS